MCVNNTSKILDHHTLAAASFFAFLAAEALIFFSSASFSAAFLAAWQDVKYK